MRRFIPIAVAGVALVLAAPASTATSTVQIKSTGFVPATVTVNQNDSVTWTNTDTKDHQVVANGGSFASAILKPGKTYTHAFRAGGTFRYHDGLHPTLKATITVRGAPPQVTLATSAPVVKFGTQVHSERNRVEQAAAGETVTLDRAAVRADDEAGRSPRCRPSPTVRSVQRHAAGEHDLPGAVERLRELGRGAGAADDQAAVRVALGLVPLLRDCRRVFRGPVRLPPALHAVAHVDQRSASCSSASSRGASCP